MHNDSTPALIGERLPREPAPELDTLNDYIGFRDLDG